MRWVFAITVLVFLFPLRSLAGVFEVSMGAAYSQSNYSDSNYHWNRRWGFSFGYHFTELSEIEIAFQDVLDRTKISGYEDTTFHDQIYSANWVQSFASKRFPVQPYVKVGGGQLNREASGTYAFGLASPPAILDSLTVVLGAGLRIYFSKTFGIRGEATTYLAGGNLSSWRDNTALTLGLSVFF